MEFLIDYWYVIVAAIVAAAMGILYAVRFAKQPKTEQLVKVREWLLWAVIKAEEKFGDHMGQVQLRYVYDLFISKFPWLAKIVSFKFFSDLVDDALAEMREMLAENEAVADYVTGVN